MPEIDDATRQEQRKKAGDFLRMADKLFKGGDYEGAGRLVQLAMTTDPQNPYALAYQERVKHAIEQRESKKLETQKTCNRNSIVETCSYSCSPPANAQP